MDTKQDADYISGEAESRMRENIGELANKMADKARFHSVSHHISAEWYERFDRWIMYSSFVLSAAGAAGAGSLLSEWSETDSGVKKKAIAVSVGANLLQSMISALNDSQYAPRKVSQEHYKAGVEMKDFQGRLDKFCKVTMNDVRIDVDELQKQFEKFQEEKKKLEGSFIKSENWTFKQVHQEISGSDSRRAKKEE